MTADQELDRVVAWLRREAEALYQEAREMLIWCDSDRDLQDILNARGCALQKSADALARHEHRETNDGN